MLEPSQKDNAQNYNEQLACLKNKTIISNWLFEKQNYNKQLACLKNKTKTTAVFEKQGYNKQLTCLKNKASTRNKIWQL